MDISEFQETAKMVDTAINRFEKFFGDKFDKLDNDLKALAENYKKVEALDKAITHQNDLGDSCRELNKEKFLNINDRFKAIEEHNKDSFQTINTRFKAIEEHNKSFWKNSVSWVSLIIGLILSCIVLFNNRNPQHSNNKNAQGIQRGP